MSSPSGDRARPAGAVRVLVPLFDWSGLALFAVLMARVFWDTNPSFVMPLAAVAAVGMAGAVVSGGFRRTPLDWPLAVYVVLAVVSYTANRHHYAATLGRDPVPDWAPVVHIALLTLYFYAAVWLLRTPRRQAAAAAAFVAVVSLFGLTATAEHLSHGISERLYDYSSLRAWGGYPQLGVLMLLASPFAMAIVMIGQSGIFVAAALWLTGWFCVNTFLLYSRSSTVVLPLTAAALAVVEIVKLRRARFAAALTVLSLGLVALLLARKGWRGIESLNPFSDSAGFRVTAWRTNMRIRLGIWKSVVAIIRDNPLLGVGLGNYHAANASYAIDAFFPTPDSAAEARLHAHNMLLHVAAESGLPAALAFLSIWWRLWRAALGGPIGRNLAGVLKIGSFGALAAYFLRGATDHFLGGLFISDRVSILVWTSFAFTAAVALVPNTDEPSPTGTSATV